LIQIIVILAVAYILSPLIDLTLAERVRSTAKIIVLVITLLWLVYTLWISGVRILG
jgi:hypothetical protein